MIVPTDTYSYFPYPLLRFLQALNIKENVVISKRPAARGPLWARLGPMGFSPTQTREAQARRKPVKGRAGPRASFQAQPGRLAHNHGLLGPPRSPLKGPPRGPLRSPFRSLPKSQLIGPPEAHLKAHLKARLKAQPLHVGFLFKLYSKVK